MHVPEFSFIYRCSFSTFSTNGVLQASDWLKQSYGCFGVYWTNLKMRLNQKYHFSFYKGSCLISRSTPKQWVEVSADVFTDHSRCLFYWPTCWMGTVCLSSSPSVLLSLSCLCLTDRAVSVTQRPSALCRSLKSAMVQMNLRHALRNSTITNLDLQC